MPTLATPLAVRRPELLLKPIGDAGSCVVKDPRTGEYFDVGAQEAFLLEQLDGRRTADEVCVAFEARFGAALLADDLQEFLALVRAMGLVVEPPHLRHAMPDGPAGSDDPSTGIALDTAPTSPAGSPKPGQNILYWRMSVLDPDRLFNWMEPRLRLLWTRGFVIVSAAVIAAAVLLAWSNRSELVTQVAHVIRWETLFLAWVTLVAATTLHEFAHGLTCKHFGGEVHEIGFLLLFFMPCFYCNVSDAWLFREKSRRLWVTLAGGYCDLCLWAIAVVAWRVTPPDTVVHYVAWLVIGICGLQSFFNFNPLLKLDGYYLLSDAVGIPNLRQRGWDRFRAQVRRLLWGAPAPEPEQRGRFLTVFGALAWAYSAVFLCVMVVGFVYWWGGKWGAAGAWAAVTLGVLVSPGVFQGLSGGEFRIMMSRRRRRVVAWVLAVVVVTAALLLVPMEDRATGPFKLRSLARAEFRAPVAGFLREVHFLEGQPVPAGAVVVRLEVPDLPSRMAQKRAEVQEGEAKLAMLKAGPRTQSDQPALWVAIHACEIEAAAAVLERLRQEALYLRDLQEKQDIAARSGGVMMTARLAEKIGQYFREGEFICEVQDPSSLEAEVAMPEHVVARVRPGQSVELKARAVPFGTFRAQVVRIAPGAATSDAQAEARPLADATNTGETAGHVSVYCTLSGPSAQLRPGMTGHARVACGKQPVGKVLATRVLRYVRTEFWW